MRWYVINPYDGEIEFDCDDDNEGQNRVLNYLSGEEMTPRFLEQGDGMKAQDMLVIRGERFTFTPPSGSATLQPTRN